MQEEAFRRHLTDQNLSPSTLNTRCSALKRVERDESVDLDREFLRDGLQGLKKRFQYDVRDEHAARPNPSSIDIEPENLRKYLAFYKSALSSYERFRLESEGGEVASEVVESDSVSEEAVESAGRTFALERDLQTALRSDLAQLEPGLVVADGGREKRVEAGSIDILAKDARGAWVVIELKAETGRPAVVAQTLAYMASVEQELGGSARGIIIAADFDNRVELAARAMPSLSLKRYRFKFDFV